MLQEEPGTPGTPAPPDTPSGPPTPGAPGTPRTTGSLLIQSHDDVVTRMKNVEMIELGRHRIRPWYFAPYPQVTIFINEQI